MKRTIIMMGVVLLSVFTISAKAQQTTWDAKKNPTVSSITTPYEGKLLPARPALTTEQIFPVLGQYQSSDAAMTGVTVKISQDPENKGLVWIEGLPQGKVKAMLRKSPATYKIPAQTTEDGKEVAEGTLIYDKDANALNIVIGKPYNNEDPAVAFAPVATEEPVVAETKTKTKGKTTKTKVKTVAPPKPWTYTGIKIENPTTMNQ